MLIPKCGNRRFPSKVQYEPSGPSSFQRESRAFTTNQPSPSTTRPFLLIRTGASGIGGVSQSERPPRARLLALEHLPEIRQLLAPHVFSLPELHALQQAAQLRRQLDRVERLRHVVDAAEVEAPGSVAELGSRRQEHDRDRRRAPVVEQLLRDAPAVEARHHHVEEDHVRRLRPRLLEAARAVGRLQHVHPLRLEVDAAEEADRSLVVDHQHCRRHRLRVLSVSSGFHSPRAAASSNVKRAPRPSSESTQMRPPIACTRPCTMKSPRPVPADEPSSAPPRYSLLKIRSCCDGGIPTPSSATVISTASARPRASTRTTPPSGENLTALSTRWSRTWRSLSRSACARRSAPSTSTTKRWPFAAAASTVATASASTDPTSIGSSDTTRSPVSRRATFRSLSTIRVSRSDSDAM